MQEERVIRSDKIYEGKVVTLRCDTVEMEGQRFARREIIEHSGSVAILALDEEGKIIFVNQYRLAANDFLLELPAGLIDRGESPIDAAKRELKEETGYEAQELNFLFEFYTSPGFTNERIHLFCAEGLTPGDQDLDETENISLVSLSLEEAMKKIRLGAILDAKTILGILSLWGRKNQGGNHDK
ncbi:MAG: NUDIX hydrolase [Tissierellia bacterium]|nr:NUDIX hydrolase [Tissierellia bacterium]